MRTLERGHTYSLHSNAHTYHCPILAGKFVNMDRISPALVVRTTLFVGGAKDVEVVVTKVSTNESIGDEFHE